MRSTSPGEIVGAAGPEATITTSRGTSSAHQTVLLIRLIFIIGHIFIRSTMARPNVRGLSGGRRGVQVGTRIKQMETGIIIGYNNGVHSLVEQTPWARADTQRGQAPRLGVFENSSFSKTPLHMQVYAEQKRHVPSNTSQVYLVVCEGASNAIRTDMTHMLICIETERDVCVCVCVCACVYSRQCLHYDRVLKWFLAQWRVGSRIPVLAGIPAWIPSLFGVLAPVRCPICIYMYI